jgi:hypothetical protein
MTTPKVNTISRSGSRFYVNPDTGSKNPGVTSVLNMLPKPFLKFWASKLVAEMAVDSIGEVVGLAMKDRQAAIDLLKRAPDRFTAKAADTGTLAHDAFEDIARAGGVRPKRVHPDAEPFVKHFMEFVKTCEPEFIFLEETVWDDEDGYAGSFDALATLHGAAAGPLQGKTLFFDWKTTRSGVHEEVALQLAAYRSAQHIIRPDGSRVPIPKTDGAAVLHVRPEGWQLVPVETDEVDGVAVMDYFRALRFVFDWDSFAKKSVILPAVASGGESDKKAGPRINKPRARKAAA